MYVHIYGWVLRRGLSNVSAVSSVLLPCKQLPNGSACELNVRGKLLRKVSAKPLTAAVFVVVFVRKCNASIKMCSVLSFPAGFCGCCCYLGFKRMVFRLFRDVKVSMQCQTGLC